MMNGQSVLCQNIFPSLYCVNDEQLIKHLLRIHRRTSRWCKDLEETGREGCEQAILEGKFSTQRERVVRPRPAF